MTFRLGPIIEREVIVTFRLDSIIERGAIMTFHLGPVIERGVAFKDMITGRVISTPVHPVGTAGRPFVKMEIDDRGDHPRELDT